MESSVLAALQRPPCVVSFSGGQDSSAVLAVATDVAQRHGLASPVPVTLRLPAVDTAEESQWQETVIRHLRLADWQRLTMTHEVDLVGPYATAVMVRHGLLWPVNAHFHAPIFQQARGGAVLTGAGGDELFWRRSQRHLSLLLAGQRRPEPRDAMRLARAASPIGLRVLAARRRHRFPTTLPWLRALARRAVQRNWFTAVAAEPVRFDDAVRRTWWHSRTRHVIGASLAKLARDVDVVVDHPLQGAAFISAVLGRVGATGYRTRVDAMRDLFSDLLPPEVVERRSKASFDRAFWTEPARAFVRSWTGAGIDHDLVLVDVLDELWKSDDPPNPLTWLLLQHAWLAARSDPDQAARASSSRSAPAAVAHVRGLRKR